MERRTLDMVLLDLEVLVLEQGTVVDPLTVRVFGGVAIDVVVGDVDLIMAE